VTLLELKEIIDQAIENCDGKVANVEISFKNSCYKIRKVSQFSVIPDIIIEIGEKVNGNCSNSDQN